jgi:hypothetical protein
VINTLSARGNFYTKCRSGYIGTFDFHLISVLKKKKQNTERIKLRKITLLKETPKSVFGTGRYGLQIICKRRYPSSG